MERNLVLPVNDANPGEKKMASLDFFQITVIFTFTANSQSLRKLDAYHYGKEDIIPFGKSSDVIRYVAFVGRTFGPVPLRKKRRSLCCNYHCTIKHETILSCSIVDKDRRRFSFSHSLTSFTLFRYSKYVHNEIYTDICR